MELAPLLCDKTGCGNEAYYEELEVDEEGDHFRSYWCEKHADYKLNLREL